jgi:hypothetical protein
MKDGSTKTLSSQLSSKLIDNYVKWKNRNFGPSQSKFKIFSEVKTLNKNLSYMHFQGACKVNKNYFNCKRRTARLLVAAHSCGMIINFSEMITGEGLTQAASLIESCNQNHIIKNVCYDNGCHLDSHVKNKHYNYKEETKKIKFFIDRFHIRYHNKDCQKYSLDKDDSVKNFNSSVCEQLFYRISKFKHITKHMSKLHFHFFYLMLFEALNKNYRN